MGFKAKILRRKKNKAKAKNLQEQLGRPFIIDVGIHSDTLPHPETGVSTAKYAAANEFGVPETASHPVLPTEGNADLQRKP